MAIVTMHRSPRHNIGRVNLRGLAVSTCTSTDLVSVVTRELGGVSQTPLTVLCVNAHIFNLAWNDAWLRGALNAADVLALDGMSVVWAVRRGGAPDAERCNMTEAFRAFLASPDLPAARVLMIGLDAASVTRAAATVEALDTPLRIVRAMDGYRGLDTYRDAVAADRPDLVVIGCGTPRSEQVVATIRELPHPAVVWHIGGGTLDFLAGNRREAPVWMRRAGLQWAHRLALDPRGMWRRYVLGNPTFVVRIMRPSRRRRA